MNIQKKLHFPYWKGMELLLFIKREFYKKDFVYLTSITLLA